MRTCLICGKELILSNEINLCSECLKKQTVNIDYGLRDITSEYIVISKEEAQELLKALEEIGKIDFLDGDVTWLKVEDINAYNRLYNALGGNKWDIE